MINPEDQSVSHYLGQLEEYMVGRKDHSGSRDLLEDEQGVETVQRYFGLMSDQYSEEKPVVRDKDQIVDDLSKASEFKQVEEDIASKVLELFDSLEPHDPEYEEILSGNIQEIDEGKYFIKINNPEIFERALDQFVPLSSSRDDYYHVGDNLLDQNRSVFDRF